MKTILRTFAMSLLSLTVSIVISHPSSADMTLTAAGVAEGFTLTTFATGFSHIGNTTTGVGPLGMTFASSGVVLVGTNPGDLYRLPNHNDGQTMTSANIVASTGQATFVGLATIGGKIYEADRANGFLFEITTTNNFSSVGFNILGPSLTVASDLRANFASGKLLVVTSGGIIEVDPANGNSRLVTGQTGGDGMTINDSGTTAYLANRSTGHVLGYNIQSGALIFDSGFINNNPSFIDGLALGTGTLSRSLFVNDNGGNLWQVNLDTNALSRIGTGGSRGDFVTVDPTNGSLFITQSDRILHLTAPSGSGFGGSVPEPSSFILLGLGLIGGLGILKRRGRPE